MSQFWLLFGMFDFQEQTYTALNMYMQSFHNVCIHFIFFSNTKILSYLPFVNDLVKKNYSTQIYTTAHVETTAHQVPTLYNTGYISIGTQKHHAE